MSNNINSSQEKVIKDWGDEVLPGVYIIKRGGNPFSHPALAAPIEGFDLKQIYEKIDECEDLIQKLMRSNRELIQFFGPSSSSSSLANQQNEDDDDDDEEEDEEEEQNEEEEEEEEENHFDPNSTDENSNHTAATSMETLMAMAAAEAERYLAEEEAGMHSNLNRDGSKKSSITNKKRNNRDRKSQKNTNNFYSGDEAPSQAIMKELPSDIQEAITENIGIIADQRKQQKELLEFTSVRQHKCAHHRVHGSAANQDTSGGNTEHEDHSNCDHRE